MQPFSMWQVTYNPSVVSWRLAVAVTFPAMGLKGNGIRIQMPLLADRCTESGRTEAGGIALSADGRILSAVTRAGLFYRLKLRPLFFRIINILHIF